MKSFLKKPLLRLLSILGSLCGHLFDRTFERDHIKKILVFQLGGIGDVLLTFPAIHALRNEFPAATISTLTEFDDDLFDLFPYPDIISRKYRYDPHGQHRTLLDKLMFLVSLKHDGFDLIFNPNRGNAIAEASIMAFIIGAPHRLGFEKDGGGFLNTIKAQFKHAQYILEQNLNLLRTIGVRSGEHSVRVQVPSREITFWDTLVKEHAISEERLLIAVHPGARHFRFYKMWPVDNYAKLIKALISRYNATVILIGDKTEVSIADEISANVGYSHIINTVGQTTITQMAALIGGSNIFIGNDSGPLHIAIALEVPSIGLFGFTSPEEIIPLHQARVIAIRASCTPVYTHQPFLKFRHHDTESLHQISVEEVGRAVNEILHTKRMKKP